MFDFRFLNISQKTITIEAINEILADTHAKRIHFATSHKACLKEASKNSKAKITLPFHDSIGPIIEAALGAENALFKSKYEGYWRSIDSNADYAKFVDFIEKYKNIVFLRDNLDLSICLSMNFGDDNEHTQIGELEYQAKFNNDASSEEKLKDLAKTWINELPFYKIADCICAMPCSNREEESLPKRIVNSLPDFGSKNISKDVYWESKTKKIKDAETTEEKFKILDNSKLKIETDVKGKTVILFDDLYMSGISLQYVAMKLKEAGAKRVFGLCLVKSRSNTTRKNEL